MASLSPESDDNYRNLPHKPGYPIFPVATLQIITSNPAHNLWNGCISIIQKRHQSNVGKYDRVPSEKQARARVCSLSKSPQKNQQSPRLYFPEAAISGYPELLPLTHPVGVFCIGFGLPESCLPWNRCIHPSLKTAAPHPHAAGGKPDARLNQPFCHPPGFLQEATLPSDSAEIKIGKKRNPVRRHPFQMHRHDSGTGTDTRPEIGRFSQ